MYIVIYIMLYTMLCVYIYIYYVLWLFKSLRTGSHGLFSSMNSDGSSTKHGDDRKLC